MKNILTRVTPQEITNVTDICNLVNLHGGDRLFYYHHVIDGRITISFGGNQFVCDVEAVETNAHIIAAMFNTAISEAVSRSFMNHISGRP
jgi:hypothetical protein